MNDQDQLKDGKSWQIQRERLRRKQEPNGFKLHSNAERYSYRLAKIGLPLLFVDVPPMSLASLLIGRQSISYTVLLVHPGAI